MKQSANVDDDKMTREEQINMWSILIAVLKNQDRPSYEIKEIDYDIADIKELIKTLK